MHADIYDTDRTARLIVVDTSHLSDTETAVTVLDRLPGDIRSSLLSPLNRNLAARVRRLASKGNPARIVKRYGNVSGIAYRVVVTHN